MADVPRYEIQPHPSLPAAVALLTEAGLPASDLAAAHMEHFFYSGSAAAPTALVGVELCGPDALLRSLVVHPGRRSTGLGTALVDHVEAYARARGARSIYLLTTTAEEFFRRRGYALARRESAPAAMKRWDAT